MWPIWSASSPPRCGAFDTGISAIKPNIDAAARTLGRPRAGMLVEIHLPLLRPSLLTALLIVFVDVMKELPATLIMRPVQFRHACRPGLPPRFRRAPAAGSPALADDRRLRPAAGDPVCFAGHHRQDRLERMAGTGLPNGLNHCPCGSARSDRGRSPRTLPICGTSQRHTGTVQSPDCPFTDPLAMQSPRHQSNAGYRPSVSMCGTKVKPASWPSFAAMTRLRPSAGAPPLQAFSTAPIGLSAALWRCKAVN
jgi:hypothetical protein